MTQGFIWALKIVLSLQGLHGPDDFSGEDRDVIQCYLLFLGYDG
jgi:hypothetical protein